MATRTTSELDEARRKAEQLQSNEERIGVLDSRDVPEKGDPWRSTLFLIAVFALTIVLCFMVMFYLAGG